ncbi:MAG: hypothetical protein KBS45_01555, partial [Clostridiales bacterium]|nr:hypothetical protein [Candidatus Coliplasma caballi]
EEYTVYYTTDKNAQSYYLGLFAQKNLPVLVFDTLIDTSYAQFLESKNEKVKFARIDSALDAVKGEGENETGSLEDLFKKAIGKDDAKVSFVPLNPEDAPALVSVSEESRRMADMMKMYSIQGGSENFSFPVEEVLTVNTESALIKKLLTLPENDPKAETIAKHVYLSAVMLSRPLSPEELKEYVALNGKILLEY